MDNLRKMTIDNNYSIVVDNLNPYRHVSIWYGYFDWFIIHRFEPTTNLNRNHMESKSKELSYIFHS